MTKVKFGVRVWIGLGFGKLELKVNSGIEGGREEWWKV